MPDMRHQDVPNREELRRALPAPELAAIREAEYPAKVPASLIAVCAKIVIPFPYPVQDKLRGNDVIACDFC
ncbi:MAG: hypothetical protein HYY80_04245 [Chloroflexi bacterium]|nr:hypothetical protein [Chloroflexota bacterium]